LSRKAKGEEAAVGMAGQQPNALLQLATRPPFRCDSVDSCCMYEPTPRAFWPACDLFGPSWKLHRPLYPGRTPALLGIGTNARPGLCVGRGYEGVCSTGELLVDASSSGGVV